MRLWAVLLLAAILVQCGLSGVHAIRRRHSTASTAAHLSHRHKEALAHLARSKRKLSANAADQEYFVTIGSDMNFYLGCQKFFMAGWNQWEVVEAGAGAPVLYGASLPPGTTGPQLIRNVMDEAASNNLTVMRAFAHAVDAAYPMETSPGVYNEQVFRGLDYALEQARQRGIKVVLSLMDNWSNPGGIDQIVAWSGTAASRANFFSDTNCMNMYKARVSTVINRVNSINGRTYAEDPTIMAWNLINEPRCYQCPNALQSWIQTMAAYVKSLDSNHLLSIGEEGFYGVADMARSNYANPEGTSTWANKEGQNFIPNHQVQGIDYAIMHSWADNWLDDTTGFQNRWIQQHDVDALEILKMPLVLEEFGKWVKNTTSATKAERQQFYTLAYNAVLQSARSGGSIKGVAFWEWFEQGQVAPAAEGYGTGLYGITTSDPVWSTIVSNAQSMAGLSTAGNCSSTKPANLPAVNQCVQTWISRTPGTGYEGRECTIDINECVRGTANCAANATCINSAGGYRCQCYWGFTGDGYSSCAPAIQIPELASAYYTLGSNQLACPEGNNVTYPTTAPGYVDDPTGYTKRQGGYGSIVEVSVLDCQIACESAAGCDSFSYNAVQQQCFLKNGASRTTCTSQVNECTSSNQNLVQQTFSCGSWQTYYRRAGAVGSQITAAALSTNAAG